MGEGFHGLLAAAARLYGEAAGFDVLGLDRRIGGGGALCVQERLRKWTAPSALRATWVGMTRTQQQGA